MDSSTGIAKENKTPRKAIVVCGRRQERQDGTLKRTKSAREEYPMIGRERDGIARKTAKTTNVMAGGTNPIRSYGDADKTLELKRTSREASDVAATQPGTLTFT